MRVFELSFTAVREELPKRMSVSLHMAVAKAAGFKSPLYRRFESCLTSCQRCMPVVW
jgi:hypothetical protein